MKSACEKNDVKLPAEKFENFGSYRKIKVFVSTVCKDCIAVFKRSISFSLEEAKETAQYKLKSLEIPFGFS